MIDPDDRFESWLTQHRVEPLAARPGAYERIMRSARRRRRSKAVAVAAALSVALTATAGTMYRLSMMPGPMNPPAATSPASNPTTATPSPSAPSQLPSSNPSTATSTPATGHPTQVSRCHAGEVRVTQKPAPGGGGGGGIHTWLIFTNTSSRTCTLYGFPGVSYVTGPSGQQVNQPAERETATTPSRVTLAPQQAAHAQLYSAHPELFDNCNPVHVDGYRVYLPDETTAVFVPAPGQQCSTNGVNVARLSPVQPGANQ